MNERLASPIDRMQGPCSPDRAELNAGLTELAPAGHCTACARVSTHAVMGLFAFLMFISIPFSCACLAGKWTRASLRSVDCSAYPFLFLGPTTIDFIHRADSSFVGSGEAVHSGLSRDWLSELQLLRAWHLGTCLDTLATYPYLFRITLGAKPSSAPCL